MTSQASIFAVIVLYRKAPLESSALRSLQASANFVEKDIELKLKILLHDNSPQGCDTRLLPSNVVYHPSSVNSGIANAYNSALQMATVEGFDWLLTLDQDTTVPESFLARIATTAVQLSDKVNVAGIVPAVFDENRFISPHVISATRSRRLAIGFAGIPNGEVAAINSATTWRISSLRDIGGFNPLFWLDYLDHWTFKTIRRANKAIYVIGDLRVEHQMSLLNRGNQLSAERFDNILISESAFYDLYQSRAQRLFNTVSLFSRLCKQLIKRADPRLRRVTWKHLKRRIFLTRASRIDGWKRAMSDRTGSSR